MKRRSIFLTDEQHDWLKHKADKSGLKLSEYLRRIIDEYRRKEGEK